MQKKRVISIKFNGPLRNLNRNTKLRSKMRLEGSIKKTVRTREITKKEKGAREEMNGKDRKNKTKQKHNGRPN